MSSLTSAGPNWVEVTTLVVALILALLAVLKWKLDSDKFTRELFDERYSIFRFFEELIVKLERHEDLGDINELRVESHFVVCRSWFLMDEDVSQFLGKFFNHIDTYQHMKDLVPESASEAKAWIDDNREELALKMDRYLSVEKGLFSAIREMIC